MAQEKTNREIARALGVGADTVKSHIRKICTKLSVRSRLGAVMTALAKGEIRFRITLIALVGGRLSLRRNGRHLQCSSLDARKA